MNYNKKKQASAFDWVVASLSMFLVFFILYVLSHFLFLPVLAIVPFVATTALIVSVWRINNRENYIVPLTLAILMIGTTVSLILYSF